MADDKSKTTRDHEVIKKWIEDRGGRPVIVEGTRAGDSALLRVDFAKPDKGLKDVSWDDFFRIFDDDELTFLYQDETKSGETSRFSKFVRE